MTRTLLRLLTPCALGALAWPGSVTAAQPVTIFAVARVTDTPEANAFMDFMASQAAAGSFKRYGFSLR